MKASEIDKVRSMYEATADSYSEMMDKEIDLPVYADLFGRLQSQIEGIPGAILDTACGSGHMLALFRARYDSQRTLIGVDLSPRMVAIAAKRLGQKASVLVGDMRLLPGIDSNSVAAVLNFFALHHLDVEGVRASMVEWFRLLAPGGHLFLATWEGSGTIDYGEASDIIALRYTSKELSEIAEDAGFIITRSVVEPVDEFPMKAIYLDCKTN